MERRGLLADAIHAFLQGREKARQWGLSLVESRTLLGLGDMYRKLGQPELAERMYLEARACIERPGFPGGQGLAEADLRLASLTRGAQQADAVIQAGTTNSSDMGLVDIAAVDAMLMALEGTRKPFIYTSGCWVLGSTGDTIADEEAPTDAPAIVAWRPALERRVLAATTRGTRSIVIRPAIVYGRGGGIPAMLINLARKSGAARYIGRGENHSPMVHVEDLADALALDLQFSADKAKRILGWTPHASSVIDDLVNGSYRIGMHSSL